MSLTESWLILTQGQLLRQEFAVKIKQNFEEKFFIMKAKVYVTLKNGVLDPQGKAIQHSVELLGFEKIKDIRQGKYFEIDLDDSFDEASAQETAAKMARDVLANPVIEDYKVEIVQ